MENKVKAIFVDSEGTLKTKSKGITQDIKDVVAKLETIGIHVVITSGLPRFITKKISLNVNASKYLISSNGADIYNHKEAKSIVSTYLMDSFVQELYNRCNSEFNLIFGTGEEEYVNTFNPYSKNAKVINSPYELIGKGIYQCHISQRDLKTDTNNLDKDIKESIGNIELSLLLGAELYNKLLNNKNQFTNLETIELEKIVRAIRFLKLQNLRKEILTFYSDYVRVGNEGVDFRNFQIQGEIPWFSLNRKGVNKGNAIIQLCKYLGISLDEVIAFGNDYNDRSMMEVVKTFICPSDSIESITTSDKNLIYDSRDGIAKVLEKVYERNR